MKSTPWAIMLLTSATCLAAELGGVGVDELAAALLGFVLHAGGLRQAPRIVAFRLGEADLVGVLLLQRRHLTESGPDRQPAALPTVPISNVRRSMIIVFPPDATRTARGANSWTVFGPFGLGATRHCGQFGRRRFPPTIIMLKLSNAYREVGESF